MSMVPPTVSAGEPPGPTALRMTLGSQLRRFREAAGVTPEISRLEHGRVGFKDRDVVDLLTLYGVVRTCELQFIHGLFLAPRCQWPGIGTAGPGLT